MEANTFARLASPKVLTALIIILLSISNMNAVSACNTTYTPPISNSTQTNYKNTTIPSASNQTNSQNTTVPSTSSQTNYQNTTIPSNNYPQTYRTYILSACNSSTYPSICFQALSPYASKIEADPLKLCNISLSLALKEARSASSAISKVLKSNNLTDIAEQVVQDCVENAKDAIEELQQSVDAMGHLSEIDKDFQMSNIKTWASAAITDGTTCSDGLDEGNVDATVRDKIRKIILNVARMTSNALYFINNLTY